MMEAKEMTYDFQAKCSERKSKELCESATLLAT